MKAFIVYCHPSEESFTSHVRDSFIKGIIDSGNEYVISDLYKMDFKSDMTEQKYLRDANYRTAQADFIVFDSTSRENPLREKNWDANLKKAYEIGKDLFA
ncbi:Flavodoxin-like fold [Treponema bryantii]|uniref:Flavodoxin-like fold n=1 Tax=Treponema bryantii TaxID=163 RepID=A0A1H9DBQ6_9SPIR|nr:NAD(P)H-dependent oxidoreductase [Treponema bryantii]SEQ10896.1 Flavodoxin-like fold [Treponema bryantii]